jgi:subtilase family serine protease
MTQSSTTPLLRRSFFLVLLMIAAVALLGRCSFAQVPDRIAANFSATDTATLKGSLHPLARPEFDQGRASASTKVPYMTLFFSPSASQQAALKVLLAAQQNPASPSYHKWLTPAQYGAQFGMSSGDLAKAEAWLQAQGFVVLDAANGRNAIHFSGTVAQVETAFHTEMHQYLVNGTKHLANSTVLALPAALADTVSGIRGVAIFPPHPMHTAVRRPVVDALKPEYTSSVSGFYYLAPSDITTIYDIKALYNAGYTGTNQKIAIVGQATISTSDLDAFRTASGLAVKEPTQITVTSPGGTSNSDDEGESDLDLEWSGAIAQNATIYFVSELGDVFGALIYAIDNNTAPIVSMSYGECELTAGTDVTQLEPMLMQANSQGQTVVISAGDDGAAGCETAITPTIAQDGLAVEYPASSSFVTSMGGTEFNEGSVNYWNSTNDSGGGSAISYIPEAAWNETAASNAMNPPEGLSSTGGGASALFSKPSWQVATGVPADGARDVPDISLDAAAIHDAYLFCSGGYCTNGFRYSDNSLTTAGGTSFDAPIFAGILALIEQKNSSTGEGNINPNLYSLYSTATSAFHDITVGNNEQPCQSDTPNCPTGTTEIGYAAGAGYDQTTGLGSIDAYNLAAVFPAASTVTTAPLFISTTTLSASTLGPAAGTSVTFTASVSVAASNTAPAGTVQFAVNGVNVGSAVTLTAGSGTNSTATYTTSFPTVGMQELVTATYSGNTTEAASTSNTLTITVGTVTAPSPSFTLAATNVTLASGASAASTITLTSANGYAGTVDFTYTTSTGFTGCLFGSSSLASAENAAVTTSFTVDTLVSDCVSTGARHLIARTGTLKASLTNSQPKPGSHSREYPIGAAAMLAGLAMLGWKRKSWPVVMVLLLAGLGTLGGLSGCGGSSGTPIGTTGTGVPAGTYTITVTGTDSTSSSITATTTFTVTVQ